MQTMLWRNRRALARQGVLVPGDGQTDHFRAGFDVLERTRPPSHPSPPWEGAFDELVADISRSAAHTAVISSEDLSLATRAQAENTFARLDGFDIDVVYGVRPFAGQLTSQWQESVKNSNQLDLPEWIADIRRRDPDSGFWRFNDVGSVLQRWKPPSGRVHVLTVPGPDAPDDELWRRFLQVVGTSPHRSTHVRRSNESLGYVEASLLARVQSHLPRRAPRNRTRNVVKGVLVPRVLAGRPNQLPIRVPSRERGWVDEETALRRDTLRRDDVALIGDLGELDVRPTSFGPVSLDGRGTDVVAMTRDALAVLLARGERQASTLRRLEDASGAGIRAAASASRDEFADRGVPITRQRRHRVAADDRLDAAGVSASDPLAALDSGGELIAELVLDQARRSQRIDELGGSGLRALLRRGATFVGRSRWSGGCLRPRQSS